MAEREIFSEIFGETIYKQAADTEGYEKDKVPLCGRSPIHTACCRCETEGPKTCGCALGQCALGLIF